MPKTPKKRIPYGEEEMRRALEDVSNGIKIREAARIHNVPYTTLYDRWKGQSPEGRKMGASGVLSKEDEKSLADWVVSCSEKGHPVTKEQLLDSVELICKRSTVPNNFVNGRPGSSWYHAFMKRHLTLSVRNGEDQSAKVANVSQEDLNQWYGDVDRYLQEKRLLNLPPSRVFICDESAFSLSPNENGVIANCRSGVKSSTINSGGKESLTTLLMIAANGDLAPPMVVYRNERIPQIIMNKSPLDWGIGMVETGNMSGPLFYEYIANVFYMWLKRNKTEFPVVLYVDGPSSYITMEVSNFCKEKLIELIVIHPNATQLLQPLNTSYFDPLKTTWQKAVISWCMENNVRSITYIDFSGILYNVLKSQNKSAVSSGFKSCGLYPFNVTEMNKERLFVKSETSLSPYNQESAEEREELSSPDYAIALRVLEKRIPNSIIDKFVAREKSTWNGPLEFEGLFHVWRNIKRICSNNSDSDASESTTMDSAGSEDSSDELENMDMKIVGI